MQAAFDTTTRGGSGVRAGDIEGEEVDGSTSLLDANGGSSGSSGSPAGPPSFGPSVRNEADEEDGVPNVTLPSHIRASTTPSGVPDRIPPRRDTSVPVAVDGWSIPMAPITLKIANTGGGNGAATLDGDATTDVTSTGDVTLRGNAQTSPGNAGNLSLVAELGGRTLASSNGFSVAAIPQDFSISFRAPVTGPRRGVRVENHWESDSGQVADLDEVERSEQVEYGSGSGIFRGVTGRNSGYLAADSSPIVDTHSVTAGALTGEGEITANQVFIFRDTRTNVTDIPVRNSGFQITRKTENVGGGTLEITTTKEGTNTTANGYSSEAGSGRVSLTQNV